MFLQLNGGPQCGEFNGSVSKLFVIFMTDGQETCNSPEAVTAEKEKLQATTIPRLITFLPNSFSG